MNTIRILLADDHAIVRAGICQVFEAEHDLEVVAEASDGEEAKSLLLKTAPDVVVLDIQMPNGTGIEVTRWARSNNIDCGILILTAYDDDPYLMAVLHAGANGFILKTSDPDKITQAVRDVYYGKSVLDQSVTEKVMDHLVGTPKLPPTEQLTDREMEVLQLVAKGHTNKAIGIQLGISDRTVQGHLSHIYNKIHVRSRTEAVMRAVRLGWISQSEGKRSG